MRDAFLPLVGLAILGLVFTSSRAWRFRQPRRMVLLVAGGFAFAFTACLVAPAFVGELDATYTSGGHSILLNCGNAFGSEHSEDGDSGPSGPSQVAKDPCAAAERQRMLDLDVLGGIGLLVGVGLVVARLITTEAPPRGPRPRQHDLADWSTPA
jgi:hypothetical protein